MTPQPLTVLIVDDEPLIRWAVTEALNDRGCRTESAGDAHSAFALLDDGHARFDVVILDYHLPDAHDLVLLAHARRISPDSRLIMLTASLSPELAAQALEAGADHVLAKPIDVHALARLALDGTGTPDA